MGDPVEFGLALSNSFPSGTGSFTYAGWFNIIVQNLAYQKQVSIWADTGAGWSDSAAGYVNALPGDRELWRAPANNSEREFVARYSVNGRTYWDNNGGKNYKFPQVFDEFAALAGNKYKVVLGTASLAGSSLEVNVGVQNLDYTKVAGIVFTTDNWSSVQTAYAHYTWTMKSGLEVWHISQPVGTAAVVQLAVFYRVLGSEYWDNNFGRNYTVSPAHEQQWGATW